MRSRALRAWGTAALGASLAAAAAHVACSDPYKPAAPFEVDAAPSPGDAAKGDVDLEEIDADGCLGVCAIQVAVGGAFGCALGSDGAVRCWGVNDIGQTGSPIGTTPLVPRKVEGLADVVQIAAGDRHACALTGAKKVLCWGSDDDGVLRGVAGGAASATPVEITGIPGTVEKIFAVSDHALALLTDGRLVCWGNNGYGQCGVAAPDGGAGPKAVPPSVVTDQVVQVGGAEEVTCVVRQSGQVECIGRNFSGQLARGATDTRFNGTLAPAQGIDAPVVHIALGTGYHLGVVLLDGRVLAWGSNARKAISGDGVSQLTTATAVSGISDAVELAAGGYFSCARRKDGTVACWGDNRNGQGGLEPDGGPAELLVPTEVQGITAATQVVAGRSGFACALQKSAVLCWGNNAQAQLGLGRVSPSEPVPSPLRLEP